MKQTRRLVLLAGWAVAAGAAAASAEPIFLSRQYTRCTNCHFSPTGGGLLTPYGRSISREELSTWGASRDGSATGREHEFAAGLLGNATGPVSLGIDLRPARLDVHAGDWSMTRNFLMNADLSAALRHREWTFYGEVGRQPRTNDDARVASFEHWIGYESARGFGARLGRFLPAHGLKLADHTSFNRAALDLGQRDQVYALELSFTRERHLVQVSAGPGFADSEAEEERRAFTATARWQVDLGPRKVLAASGLYRASSPTEPRRGAAGLAMGLAPSSRLTLWTQADARFEDGRPPEGTFLVQAAIEVHRGIWVHVTPQLRTDSDRGTDGVYRLAAGLNLLPRTHWNVVVSYYDDHDRATDRSVRTLLLQLHLYI